VFSGDFRFYYGHPHPGSLSLLNFFTSIGWWAPFSGVSHPGLNP